MHVLLNDSEVMCIIFMKKDERYLASGDDEGFLKIWDWQQETIHIQINASNDWIRSIN